MRPTCVSFLLSNLLCFHQKWSLFVLNFKSFELVSISFTLLFKVSASFIVPKISFVSFSSLCVYRTFLSMVRLSESLKNFFAFFWTHTSAWVSECCYHWYSVIFVKLLLLSSGNVKKVKTRFSKKKNFLYFRIFQVHLTFFADFEFAQLNFSFSFFRPLARKKRIRMWIMLSVCQCDQI